jgi:hypothetical protein
MKNYRVSFDYAAENPTKAIIYMIGIIEDPDRRNMQLHWLVTDLETGEERKIIRSVEQLEEQARAENEEFLGGEDSEKG